MKNIKMLGLLIFLLCGYNANTCAAQSEPPPAMAMPSDENKSLVDTIILLTQYEQYFYKQCVGAVDGIAERKRWTPQKIAQIKVSIRFEYFNHTIYNLFGTYKKDELLALIKKYKADPFCLRNNAILDSWMVQSNLNVFMEALVEGKYVTN